MLSGHNKPTMAKGNLSASLQPLMDTASESIKHVAWTTDHWAATDYNALPLDLTPVLPLNLSLALSNETFAYAYDYGPARDALVIVIPVTIIYVLIFITGVIGNISTCIVIKKHRSLHTATNYYLFSLAISDFLLLISGVPQEIFLIWCKHQYLFGEYFCIGRGLLAETSANATVATITAFTVERYIAICHPFLGQAMSKLSRAIRLIILIWLLAIVTAIPQAAQFGIVAYAGMQKCAVVRVIIEHSFQLSTFIFFLAPMSIILVLYVLIGIRLSRANLIGMHRTSSGSAGGAADAATANGSEHRIRRYVANQRTHSGIKSEHSDTKLYRLSAGGTQLSAVRGRMNQYGTRRVLKMLVAVVICFFICWAPFHAQRLIAVYATGHVAETTTSAKEATDDDYIAHDATTLTTTTTTNQHEMLYTVMTYISGVLYYLSTCINPLLYNLMSNKFRQAFKAIWLRKRFKNSASINSQHRQQQHQQQLYHQESRRLRRISTMTSTSQRENSLPELHSKQTILHVVH